MYFLSNPCLSIFLAYIKKIISSDFIIIILEFFINGHNIISSKLYYFSVENYIIMHGVHTDHQYFHAQDHFLFHLGFFLLNNRGFSPFITQKFSFNFIISSLGIYVNHHETDISCTNLLFYFVQDFKLIY